MFISDGVCVSVCVWLVWLSYDPHIRIMIILYIYIKYRRRPTLEHRHHYTYDDCFGTFNTIHCMCVAYTLALVRARTRPFIELFLIFHSETLEIPCN